MHRSCRAASSLSNLGRRALGQRIFRRNFAQSVVITAAGPDRNGVVAGISKQLTDFKGNMEESRMTILGNDFALITLVTLPETADADKLVASIQDAFPDFMVSGRSTSAESNLVDLDGPVRILQLQLEGPDQPGINAGLSQILADFGISIRDLDTDTSSAPFAGYKVFSCKAVVAVPQTVTFVDLDARLKEFESNFGLDMQITDPTSHKDDYVEKDFTDTTA